MNKEELKELAATLNGIADGKAWERTNSITGEWCDPDHCGPELCITMGRKIRLKPWSLPPPPDGMQWHRDDWTEEMLEGGWRPHLLGEVDNGDEEYLSYGTWRNGYYGSSEPTEASDPHRRTKAPLPQPDPYAELKAAHAAGKVIQYSCDGKNYWDDILPAWCDGPDRYRIKPEQQKVPLQPSDVPPGTVLRGAGEAATPEHQGWCMITSSSLTGIRIWRHSDYNQTEIKWETLMDASSEIWRPTDTSWQPCYKFIDTP